MKTEKLIHSNGSITIPLKFKLHQKVYHPRITEQRKLIDIREYYIVRINENTRGKLFYEGNQLFGSYEEALEYAKAEGCNIENI